MASVISLAKHVAFVCSLLWIVWRIFQVWRKPIDELIDLLGLDIPPIPEASLAGITHETVLLYFRPPENQPPSLRHFIQVNGIKVGEFGRGDTSIQVTGLKPGHFYNVRVIATNAANFSTLGPLIRLRTNVAPIIDGNGVTVLGERSHHDVLKEHEPTGIRTTSSVVESVPHVPSYPISREYIGVSHHAKRTTSGRRNSPINHMIEHSSDRANDTRTGNDDDTGDNAQQLIEKLDFLRREQLIVNAQIEEEEQEAQRSQGQLTSERDDLKQVLDEKDKLSSELRRQGTQLDRLNRTAQSRKATKEKILKQKRAERQRMKDEITRWNGDILDMRRDTEDILQEEAAEVEAQDQKLMQVRVGIAEDQAVIKTLEESIRTKGIKIKDLESQREKSFTGQTTEEKERTLSEDADQAWETRLHTAQAHNQALWQQYQQAEAESQQAQERLSWWQTLYSRESTRFGPVALDDNSSPFRSAKLRQIRYSDSRTSNFSSPSIIHQTAPSIYNSIASISPTFGSTSPYFSMTNGVAAFSHRQHSHFTQAAADSLTGGAPMSPTANDLLPSNLLGDDEPSEPHLSAIAGYGSSSGTDLDQLQRKGTNSFDMASHGLSSPASANSRDASIFQSPTESPHIPMGYSFNTDPIAESDKRSIHSTTNSLGPPVGTDTTLLATRRLTNLFNFANRQRGKTTAQEAPLLGTLKQGQSQSFPPELEPETITPLNTSRRRGTYAWTAGFLNRNSGASSAALEGNGLVATRTASGRSSRLNMFGSRFDALEPSDLSDRPSSPRPSSTYSYDNILPRPSTESQRLAHIALDNTASRSSPLGVNWGAIGGPWARGQSRGQSSGQSRRTSGHFGSSSNLSIGSTPLEPESLENHQTTEQMPIGTRPQSSHRSVTPKLNPAAPSFRTMFSRGEGKKGTKADKAPARVEEIPRLKGGEGTDDEETRSLRDEASPSNPRLSKDSHSIATADSLADSRESLDRSTSGIASEALTPSGPKETLMQKITRKSSSSKFASWSKDRNLFSKKSGEPSTPGELDEDGSNDGQLGKSYDSVGSTPQQERASRSSLSWPNIRRKPKKGDKPVTENVERASETGDDDEM